MLPVIEGLLKEIFPAENYKKAGKHMALHYLIALGQPNETITDWVKKNPSSINFKDALHLNLTPLMVSVLKGNDSITKLLLDKGANHTIQDHQGWAAIHHAVVVGNAFACDLLKGKKGATKLLNAFNGNYLDLKNLISLKPAEDQEEVFFLREAGKTTKCTAQKFKEITGASYCSSMVVTPRQLMISWKKKQETVFGFLSPKYVENEYERCLHTPTRISLGKFDKDASHGYDVFAEQAISAFKGITIYGGALANNAACTDYLLDKIDGKDMRNLGPMINDGFPNCTCVPLVFKGCHYYVVISIRDIQPGEALYWNYGVNHSLKLSEVHLELNKDELIDYSKQINISIPDFIHLYKHQILKYLQEREKIKYLLETPSALIYLLSKSSFPINLIGHLDMNDWNIFEQLLLDKNKYTNQIQIARICCGIEVALQTINALQGIDGEIRATLFKWCSTLPTSLVTSYLAFFVNNLQLAKSADWDWNLFKADLDEYVSFMEALYCFSSQLTIDHMKFFPEIKNHYLTLGREKKEEGIQNIQTYAEGMDDQTRKELLIQLAKELAEL